MQGIAQSCIFSLTVCDFVLLKLFLETARLMCVKKVWLCVRGPFCLKLHVVVVLDTGSFWFLLCLICSYFYNWSAFRGRVECSCNWCNPVMFYALVPSQVNVGQWLYPSDFHLLVSFKNFNEWWVFSFYAVTARRPQIYKKNMYKIKKKQNDRTSY
jgi:hypothetical protein